MTNSIITVLNALLLVVVDAVDRIACEDELFNHSVLPCHYYYLLRIPKLWNIFYVFSTVFCLSFSAYFRGSQASMCECDSTQKSTHEKMHESWNGRGETFYQSVIVRVYSLGDGTRMNHIRHNTQIMIVI